MKKEGKQFVKRISIILIFITIIASIGTAREFTQNTNDISEIYNMVDQYQVKYRSERGFGNDRFDIYSFSLKDVDGKEAFQPGDHEMEDKYQNYYQFLEPGSDNNEQRKNAKAEIRADLDMLSQEGDLCYKYVSLEGTYKLYLYSKKQNRGYCMIFTI